MRIVLLALVAGCGFRPTPSELSTIDGNDGMGSDVNTTCGVDCPWGCLTQSGPHCGALVPSGGAVTGGDFEGAMDATVATTIDTGDGANMKPKLDGVAWADYRQINGVTIFRVKHFHVTADVAVTGKLALAIVATEGVQLDGVIDATENCNDPAALVGGFAGGSPHMVGDGPNGGGGGAASGDDKGGGGGGNGGAGGPGGGGQAGGTAYGISDLPIAQLLGGGGGGGGNGNGGPVGGNGGAAIQIASNVSITIATAGGINAGGCGGKGSGDHSGGGGGAGGTILLEAPHVRIDGWLAVNGGGGGAGVGTPVLRDGSPGTLDRVPADGGAGTVAGASGAAGAVLVGGTGTTTAGVSSGGGGGAGRIRIDTVDGAVSGTGMSSPGTQDAPTTCTHATATVQ